MKSYRTLLSFILIAYGGAAFGAGIPAQPIVTLDPKKIGDTEQSDFFLIQGPGKGGVIVPKLVFSAKVKDLPKTGAEQRALFVQKLESEADPTTHYFLVDKTSPLMKIGVYTVAAGTRFDSFIPTTDTSGNSAKPRYDQMFFHVPGRGLLVTEGGKTPKTVRPENKNDSTTSIVLGALRLSDYRSNNTDVTLQSRLFFTSKDAAKGREPFIYGGSGAKVLKDIDPTKKMGSDPDQYAVLGPQNDTQRVFFVAKNPNDGGNYNLWIVTITPDSKGRPVYDATVFADSSVIPGKPENLVANGSDLFFTAPSAASPNTPVLWHLPSSGASANDLEVFPTTSDPQQLTFINEDSSYSDLAFTTFFNNEQRYASWHHANDSVTIIGNNYGLIGASLITPANDYFYFAAANLAGTPTSLCQHHLANDTINNIYPAGAQAFVNIREICRVSNTIYFVADGSIGGNPVTDVLWQLDNTTGGVIASPVLTPQNHAVAGAHNLRAVIDAGSGLFRLYFTAPVNSTTNSEFIPANSTITDFGTKPWVTAVDGN